MDFKDIFTKLLEDTGTSAHRLAQATGISEGLISDYKNGRSKPKYANAQKIAFFFGKTTNFLLGIENGDSAESSTDTKGLDYRARTFQEYPAWIQDAALEIMRTLAEKVKPD